MTHRIALLVLLAATSCAGPPPAGTARVEIDLPAQARSLPQGPNAIADLYRSELQHVRLIRSTAPLPTHRHRYSEETVSLLAGTGVLHLEGVDRELRAGDLVVVPRNTLHGFTPTGAEPTVVLSILAPPLEEGDRHLEERRVPPPQR